MYTQYHYNILMASQMNLTSLLIKMTKKMKQKEFLRLRKVEIMYLFFCFYYRAEYNDQEKQK